MAKRGLYQRAVIYHTGELDTITKQVIMCYQTQDRSVNPFGHLRLNLKGILNFYNSSRCVVYLI